VTALRDGAPYLPPELPLPPVNGTNAGFWKAASEGRLDVQQCRACGAHRHPPTEGCYRCASLDWAWDTLPGTGTVFTFLPTFAESMGVTGLGLFYTAYSVSAVAVRLFGGELIDSQGRRAVIVPSMIVFTAAVCMLALLAGTVRPGVPLPLLPRGR